MGKKSLAFRRNRIQYVRVNGGRNLCGHLTRLKRAGCLDSIITSPPLPIYVGPPRTAFQFTQGLSL